MKVLVISNYYPPHFVGGYEIACKESTDFLIEKGHEVFILTGIHGIKENPHELLKADVPYRRLQYIDYSHGGIRQKSQVEKYNYKITDNVIKQIQPDIVFLWSQKAISIAPGIAVQKNRCRKIYQIGDTWMDVYQQPGFSNSIKRFIKSCMPTLIGGKLTISPMIIVSRWLEEEMVRRFSPERTYIIPNGILIPESLENHHKESRVRYLFAGRLEPRKGIELALNALALLKKNGFSDFVFDIYGTGDETYLKLIEEKIKDLNLTGAVHLKGLTNDIYSVYNDYDIFLMPTLARETFGRVVIEAMVHELVVIATNKFGPKEIIEDGSNGFLFERGDAQALFEIINRVHCDRNLWKRIGKRAYDDVKKRFDIQFVNSSIEQILVKEIQLQ